MVAFDFEYDGQLLSELGYTVCNFGSDGLQTVSNGSQITFNTTPILSGIKHELTDTNYENCLESTFSICKNPCASNNNWEISMDELRYLMRWLNRKKFHKFKWIHEDYFDLYLEASFNISKITIGGKICGLELTMTTNRPFSMRTPRTITIKNSEINGKYSLFDVSDEEGFIYPHTEIVLQSSGNLTIHNSLDDKVMSIAGCSNGEVITLDYPYIYSSISTHKIENDFNWNFLRIGNTFADKRNDLTISLPCIINVSYSPIIKSGT